LNSCQISFIFKQIFCKSKYYETKEWSTKLHMLVSPDEQAYKIKLPEDNDYTYKHDK